MDVADALARGDLASAPLADQDRVVLDYVDKLTLRPGEMIEDDVRALRSAGFDDVAIGDIAMVAATYAFMNSIVDGLGCSLPRGWDEEAERLGILHP